MHPNNTNEMIALENYQSGHYEQGTGYKYFVPTKINDEWTWKDPAISNLLEKASLRLGELNSYSRLVPNIDLFIQLHVTKEAVLSSRIEGTQTHIDEALLPQSEVREERRNDWQEVRNYVNAINDAIENKQDQKFATSKEADAILKLTVAIKNLETETNIAEKMATGKEFLAFVRKTSGFELSKDVAKLFNAYIKSCL